jgi:thiamine monophosphate synthase
MMYFKGICFITDSKYSDLPLYDMINVVLRAGVKWVQYREKDLSRREIYANAVTLRELTRSLMQRLSSTTTQISRLLSG